MADRWYTARMATKKKTKKKQTTRRIARKKAAPKKKGKAAKRHLPKKKPALKKATVNTKARGRKAPARKAARPVARQARGKSQIVDQVVFAAEGLRPRSGGQSGALQGLSNVESADSESVDELLEEGNAFEAEVVKGVEDAGDADESEVHTHEVPQDDVPGEYRRKK